MNKREEKKELARWYQDETDGLYAVVRHIIDDGLATKKRVSIYRVREHGS